MIDTGTTKDLEKPSKSQLKREAKELTGMAKKLLNMTVARLSNMPLDEELRQAVDFGRSIRAHGARKRHTQTIGKMLRNRDAQPLADALHNLDANNRLSNARLHRIEAWRDLLIDGNDQGLTSLLSQYAGANTQTLRQLVRKAKKEVQLSKPPAAARKLFRLLREADKENPLPPLSKD